MFGNNLWPQITKKELIDILLVTEYHLNNDIIFKITIKREDGAADS